MVISSRVWSATVVGIGLLMGGTSAKAQSPGLYYSWRSIDNDITGCIDRAATAMNSQELGNIQIESNSISGTTEDTTAVFVCLEGPGSTTVMIMVSSINDENAFELREALKGAF